MPALPIRYSPSGPIIGNDDGGEATPGEGFTLRIATRQATAGALVFSGVLQTVPESGADFIIGLANPKPGLRYMAEIIAAVENTGAAAATFQMRLQNRVDGGAWSAGATGGTVFQQISASNVAVHYHFSSQLILGSDLPNPVLDATALLEVSFGALVSVGGAQLGGTTLYGRLWETL